MFSSEIPKGIVASLIAAPIIAVLAAFWKFITSQECTIISIILLIIGVFIIVMLVLLYMKVFEGGKPFKDWDQANPDILKELKKSKKFYVMAGRGHFLLGESYKRYMIDGNNEVLILLPDIDNGCKKQNWISQRVDEMKKVSAARLNEDKLLIGEIQDVINQIKGYFTSGGNNGKRHIAYFDSLHIGKIVLMEKVGYFQPYLSDRIGEDGTVYKYKKSSYMYKWLERLVNEIDRSAIPLGSDNKFKCEQYNIQNGGVN